MLNETDRKMGQFRRDRDPVKARLARAYHEISQAWIEAYGDFPKQMLFAKTEDTDAQAPKVDLRQRTYELLHLIVNPLDEEKKELREKRGLVFLPMRSQSYAQIVAEHPEHYWDGELSYANSGGALRDFVPPVAVEVGLCEAHLVLLGSFNKPRATALQMIEAYSQRLEAEFPGFEAIMLPATGYASVDRAYSERNPGRVLFKNCSALCLDDVSEYVARAGRDAAAGRFYVIGSEAGDPDRLIGAVPAVVKIGSS